MNSNRERQFLTLIKSYYQVPRNGPLKTNYKNQKINQDKTISKQ